jgi:hypothetical protein
MAKSQQSKMPRVAFFTSAWERDWPIVLNPERFEANLASCIHDFPVRLVVLNNFASAASAAKARRMADRLVELGLATMVADHAEVLTDEALEQFGLKADTFWASNPYFSTAHLTALHVLEGQADYAFFLNGDVWLQDRSDWVPRALEALAPRKDVRGLNLCRNIYREMYPQWAEDETDTLWVSGPPPPSYPNPRKGFSLSDHVYLLEVLPDGRRWQFDNSDALTPYLADYPPYARPCFEAFVKAANGRDGFGHAALKPSPGPISMHKKGLPKSKLKRWFYLAIGHFRPGGKWAPPPIAGS